MDKLGPSDSDRDVPREEPTPIEVPIPRTEREALIALGHDVKGLAAKVDRLVDALPRMVTRRECARRHPGIAHWLQFALLLAAIGAGVIQAHRLGTRVDATALAAEQRRETPSVPVPSFVPAPPPDAAVPVVAGPRRPKKAAPR